MNQENQSKLIAAFPRLYRRASAQTESGAFWGIECGDGWLDLLMQLSEAIENQAEKEGRCNADWPEVDGIKQSHGVLSFSMLGVNDATWDLICLAEGQSKHICESCGSPGELNGDYWLNVSCTSCN